jgi:hypothetical protein
MGSVWGAMVPSALPGARILPEVAHLLLWNLTNRGGGGRVRLSRADRCTAEEGPCADQDGQPRPR